jgi:hypothetical protein
MLAYQCCSLPSGRWRRLRRLSWPDCHNARDLGAFPCWGGHVPDDALVRAITTAVAAVADAPDGALLAVTDAAAGQRLI